MCIVDTLQVTFKVTHSNIIQITVGENIIATTKMRNNYGAIQSFIFPILR